MSKITAMYIRLSMEDEDVSLNQKEALRDDVKAL